MPDNTVIGPIGAPTDPPYVGSERDLLVAFIDFFRDVLLRKAAGLTREQLSTRVGASSLTLGGLIKHMAFVEQIWFTVRWRGEPPTAPWADVDWDAQPDWELESAVHDDPGALAALYLESIGRSRSAIADSHDLDATFESGGRTISMRWMLLHMIEEYARHCGHADLLRESIDGQVGD